MPSFPTVATYIVVPLLVSAGTNAVFGETFPRPNCEFCGLMTGPKFIPLPDEAKLRLLSVPTQQRNTSPLLNEVAPTSVSSAEFTTIDVDCGVPVRPASKVIVL